MCWLRPINDNGNWILVNEEHLLKQHLPIDVTPSGIVIAEMFELINVSTPILNKVDGKWIFVNDVQ